MARAFAVLCLLLARSAAGQDAAGPRVDPIRTGVIEFGISAGYGTGDVGGSKVNLPGVVTYRVEGKGGAAGKLHVGVGMWSRYQLVAEAAWMSGGRKTSDLGDGSVVETRANAIIYDACVHIRFPIHGRRFVPHLALGGGNVQSRTDTLVRFNAPVPTEGKPLDAATQVRQREGSFAPVAGVGTQVYLARRRLGFRVEAKSYFPTGTSRTPFVQITAGILTWVR